MGEARNGWLLAVSHADAYDGRNFVCIISARQTNERRQCETWGFRNMPRSGRKGPIQTDLPPAPQKTPVQANDRHRLKYLRQTPRIQACPRIQNKPPNFDAVFIKSFTEWRTQFA